MFVSLISTERTVWRRPARSVDCLFACCLVYCCRAVRCSRIGFVLCVFCNVYVHELSAFVWLTQLLCRLLWLFTVVVVCFCVSVVPDVPRAPL